MERYLTESTVENMPPEGLDCWKHPPDAIIECWDKYTSSLRRLGFPGGEWMRDGFYYEDKCASEKNIRRILDPEWKEPQTLHETLSELQEISEHAEQPALTLEQKMWWDAYLGAQCEDVPAVRMADIALQAFRDKFPGVI